jgi:hypothetical protein
MNLDLKSRYDGKVGEDRSVGVFKGFKKEKKYCMKTCYQIISMLSDYTVLSDNMLSADILMLSDNILVSDNMLSDNIMLCDK